MRDRPNFQWPEIFPRYSKNSLVELLVSRSTTLFNFYILVTMLFLQIISQDGKFLLPSRSDCLTSICSKETCTLNLCLYRCVIFFCNLEAIEVSEFISRWNIFNTRRAAKANFFYIGDERVHIIKFYYARNIGLLKDLYVTFEWFNSQ